MGDWKKTFKVIKEGTKNKEIDSRNKFNELNGTEWIKFTKSWFIFDAKQSDLKEERNISKNTEHHPATFSPTLISEFIQFFTKKNQVVLDPFLGIGSTLVACDRTGRIGIGIELNKKYANLAKKRTKQKVIIGDAKDIDKLDIPLIDFCISSPPYWNVLERSTKDFKKKREKNGLDVKYSENKKDLGNIEDYNSFLEELYKIYEKIHHKLKNGGYVVIIIKNIKKKGEFYPLAWDLAKKLSGLYVLKDEKVWCQDHIALAPYGYPFAWVSNIVHHYCIILRKEEDN